MLYRISGIFRMLQIFGYTWVEICPIYGMSQSLCVHVTHVLRTHTYSVCTCTWLHVYILVTGSPVLCGITMCGKAYFLWICVWPQLAALCYFFCVSCEKWLQFDVWHIFVPHFILFLLFRLMNQLFFPKKTVDTALLTRYYCFKHLLSQSNILLSSPIPLSPLSLIPSSPLPSPLSPSSQDLSTIGPKRYESKTVPQKSTSKVKRKAENNQNLSNAKRSRRLM